jgi:sensor domain CHASE-containing protein/nitrogen-specific signal transduction histidine kinase
MQLWTKVLMAIFLSWSLMAGAIYLGSKIIIEKSYSYLEEEQVKVDLNRTKNALNSLVTIINSSLLGFALWDEMYEYAIDYNNVTKKEKNKKFLEQNFQPEIFNAFGSGYINFVILFDTYGKINPAYSGQLNKDKTKFTSLSEEIKHLFQPPNRLAKLVIPAGKNSDVVGLINTSKGITILTSHSVRLYSGEGESHGTLMFGRYIDKTAWDSMIKSSKLNMTIYSLNQIKEKKDLQNVYSLLLTKNVISQPVNLQKRFLYILLKDISGHPIGMIQVVLQRELNLLGQKIINYFNIIFFVSSIIFILLLFYVLRLVIINRLIKINNVITDIRRTQNFNLRVPVKNHDEISLISTQINNMLTTISEVEMLLINIINSMPSMIILLDIHLNITNLNSLAETFIQLPTNKARGKPVFELFPFLKPYHDKLAFVLKEESVQEIEKISYDEKNEMYYFDVTIYSFNKLDKKILAIRIDNVTEHIKFQQHIEMSEKLAAVGMLTTGLTYEISEPVKSISSNFPLLEKNLTLICNASKAYSSKEMILQQIQKNENNQLITYTIMSETNALLDDIKENAMKIVSIVDVLKTFVRLDEDTMKKTDIHQGMDAILILSRYYYKDRIKIKKEYSPIKPIDAFPGRINQVLLSILSYSISRITDRGEILIKTELNEPFMSITIRDNGTLIDSEGLQKDLNSGFDINLSNNKLSLNLAYNIIIEHGGNMIVKSNAKIGTEFIIILPTTHALTDDCIDGNK